MVEVLRRVKPFVFVLMPFHQDFDDIYQLGIKAACASAGAYCERVDEQIFAENILERVYNQIAKADIIISEMTGRNPNVFYETGYAHALNKRVILLTQNTDDIPFDLKHYPHIVYGGKIAHLKTELEKRVSWYIENPTTSITQAHMDFQFVINGNTWHENLELEIPIIKGMERGEFIARPLLEHVTPSSDGEIDNGASQTLRETGILYFEIQFAFRNITNTVIESSNYHLSLVTPRIFSVRKSGGSSSPVDIVTYHGQNAIIRFATHRTVFPDDWNGAEIDFYIEEKNLSKTPSKFILKLFSGIGAKDYSFWVKFTSEKTDG